MERHEIAAPLSMNTKPEVDRRVRAASPVRVNVTPQGVRRHFGGQRAVAKPKTQSLFEISKHAFGCFQVWFARIRDKTKQLRDSKGNVLTSPRSKIEETANYATVKLLSSGTSG